MKNFVSLLVLLSATADLLLAKDAVLWNTDGGDTSAASVADQFNQATFDNPLLLFRTGTLDLADFSKLIGAYGTGNRESAIAGAIRGSKGYGAEDLAEDIDPFLRRVPADRVLLYKDAADNTQLQLASTWTVIVVEADSLEKLDAKLAQFFADFPARRYHAILTGKTQTTTTPVSHKIAKRQTTTTTSSNTTGNGTAINGTTCLFYVRGLIVTVAASDDTYKIPINQSASSNSSSCSSTSTTANFTLSYSGNWTAHGYTVTALNIAMTFNATKDGYWALGNLTVTKLTLTGKSGKTNMTLTKTTQTKFQNMQIYSVSKWGFACWETAPAPIINSTTNAKTVVGIAFDHLHVEPFDVTDGQYSVNIDDCVPFFSIGTWMGIISSWVLIMVFLFGLAMIMNLKTMDRFDDPKGKPLQINVRE